jgi:hypothetical protein
MWENYHFEETCPCLSPPQTRNFQSGYGCSAGVSDLGSDRGDLECSCVGFRRSCYY